MENVPLIYIVMLLGCAILLTIWWALGLDKSPEEEDRIRDAREVRRRDREARVAAKTGSSTTHTLLVLFASLPFPTMQRVAAVPVAVTWPNRLFNGESPALSHDDKLCIIDSLTKCGNDEMMRDVLTVAAREETEPELRSAIAAALRGARVALAA
jgi:hypothetical protein